MTKNERREFLRQSALFLAGLAACRPSKSSETKAPDAAPPPSSPAAERAFLPEQRRTFEAASWRILPSDQDPGAKEANVVEYVDRELARPEFSTLKKIVLAGLVGLDRFADKRGSKPFTDLRPEEQDEVIAQVQKASERGQDFIKFLVYLTLEGFVCDPMYGGNQGGVGWNFIGYAPGNPDGSGRGSHGDRHH
jgi:gluconate 2-dehydrogenase gamma chain